MQDTITGWPAGGPGKPRRLRVAGGKDSPRAADFPKRIVVFSPHPDDDVISMGGTFIRLCEQGHEVHVAYKTSGNIAVWDESADRHVDFVEEFCRAFDVGTIVSPGERAARRSPRRSGPSSRRSRPVPSTFRNSRRSRG